MLPNATGRYPVIDPARLGRMLVLEDIDTDAALMAVPCHHAALLPRAHPHAPPARPRATSRGFVPIDA
jgi:hypothetical protein